MIHDILNDFVSRDVPSSNGGKPKVNGAYIIVHKEGLYVGSTNDLYKRALLHKSDLNTKTHASRLLQEAYNREPGYQFHSIITATREEAYAIEQELLDMYLGKCLFNKSREARRIIFKRGQATPENRLKFINNLSGHIGLPLSEEQKQKISRSLKGKKKSAMHVEKFRNNHHSSIKVMIDGIRYRSLSEAGEKLHTDRHTVRERIESNDEKYSNWEYG